jgi:hypothetical protein
MHENERNNLQLLLDHEMVPTPTEGTVRDPILVVSSVVVLVEVVAGCFGLDVVVLACGDDNALIRSMIVRVGGDKV